MPEYVYRAITKEGVIVRNRVESPSKQNLIKRLKGGDLLPIDIIQVGYGRKKAGKVARRNVTDIDQIMKTANSATIVQGRGRKQQTTLEKINLALSKQEKIKKRDLVVFTQNFYLLKKADFNNIHALSTIIQSTENITFKGILEDILAGVEAGEYMYTTMEYYADVFPYIYINMIKVGELSGSLTQSLQQAIKYLYSKTITIGTDSNKKTISRTTPGTSSSYREPDLVVGDDGASYDAKDTYYKTILGDTGTKEQLAQLFADEYKAMIESVSKYGGFYIGRYELSSEGVQKDKLPLTETNWYNLYKKCTELNASDKVETRMIWGCQWDVTMNWLISSGAKTSNEVNKDSSSWGNYKDSTENAKVTVTEEDGTTTNKYGRKQNTGYSEYWKANNIYDLAGNCYEWTQEAYSANYRACRGGDYVSYGSSYPASLRSVDYPDYGDGGGLRFSSNFNNKVESINLSV